ncbi:MAG: MBL fold metallo-hydrolase [Pseudomonadota bacterium]
MIFTHIRNATALLDVNGMTFLIDPYLAPKGSGGVYGGEISRGVSPLVDLPAPPETIIARADALLLTHVHEDHLDQVALDALPRDLPVLCHSRDEAFMEGHGFTDITTIDEKTQWRGVTLTPTPATHGPEEVWHYIGGVSGYLIEAEGSPTLYLPSDTVLTDEVAQLVSRERPDVIVTNSGGAFSKGRFGPIIMDAEQTAEILQLAPWAEVVAVHLETTDHCTVTRHSLKDHVRQTDPTLLSRLHIPDDGEAMDLKALVAT